MERLISQRPPPEKPTKAFSLKVVMGRERSEGWAGKVWALQQGVEAAKTVDHEYFWFTDAGYSALTGCVWRLSWRRAEEEGLDMVSVMAKLHVSTFWDKLSHTGLRVLFSESYIHFTG